MRKEGGEGRGLCKEGDRDRGGWEFWKEGGEGGGRRWLWRKGGGGEEGRKGKEDVERKGEKRAETRWPLNEGGKGGKGAGVYGNKGEKRERGEGGGSGSVR